MALSNKQLAFVNEYLKDFNATQAAIRAGYSEKTARSIGQQLLTKLDIAAEIRARVSELAMSADEVLLRLGELGRGTPGLFFKPSERWTEEPLPTEEILEEEDFIKLIADIPVKCKRYKVRKIVVDLEKVIDPRYSGLISEFTDSPRHGMSIKTSHKIQALQTLAKIHRLDSDGNKDEQENAAPFVLPAELLAPNFLEVYDDIKEHNNTEYLFRGGRGSAKSTFISLILILLLKNNPNMHILAMRQVANTLKDSVYAQIEWAINELDKYYPGLRDQFRFSKSPLGITYKPTGQKIYFRGANEPSRIKSIKPSFGYIGAVWFEELDQFHGPEAIRKIEQSAVRGTDIAYIFKSYNPPPTASNWVNKYALIPKPRQYQHKSTYLDLGPRMKWLGKVFTDEAEFLKSTNERGYKHEYLGEVTGTGGMVFENLQLRKITDKEIAQFDHVCHGQDWGYYPDPAHYSRCHYDAARRILYIYGEYRAWKLNNRRLYDAIKEQAGYTNDGLLIADSEDPKSVADFVEFGANCRKAEKGPESVKYSIRWLQGLTAIIIDPERCKYTAEEFTTYEYVQGPDGDYISEFPDKDNHAIDSVRYATNLIWRQRGK